MLARVYKRRIDPMAAALAEARAAGARGEVPVGAAVAAPDGALLAAAGNRTEALRDPTAHAEMLALRAAAARLASPRLAGCDLYVTLEPCPMCAQAASFARIRRVYYGCADPKGGGIDNGPRVYAHASCHHRPEVYGGIGEAEAARLLRAFFAARRRRTGGVAGSSGTKGPRRRSPVFAGGCPARDSKA